MAVTRRTAGLFVLGAGVALAGLLPRLSGSHGTALAAAQEQAPNRREFSMTARDYRFTPDRLEVMQDDLVKVTITSADVAYSFTIDQYRVSKRIPAGGSSTIEFRADQPGTFDFYSNMTSDERHTKMRGQLIVRRR
jgi:heme/copper-type cytochrome/quinol oxidase subunit 2